jgi:uncharacterized protein (DUF433 family)
MKWSLNPETLWSSFTRVSIDFRIWWAHYQIMNLLRPITMEPDKCGGRPCIRGLRIRVADILGMLAEGVSNEEILKDFPYLEQDDIMASLTYARSRNF